MFKEVKLIMVGAYYDRHELMLLFMSLETCEVFNQYLGEDLSHITQSTPIDYANARLSYWHIHSSTNREWYNLNDLIPKYIAMGTFSTQTLGTWLTASDFSTIIKPLSTHKPPLLPNTIVAQLNWSRLGSDAPLCDGIRNDFKRDVRRGVYNAVVMPATYAMKALKSPYPLDVALHFAPYVSALRSCLSELKQRKKKKRKKACIASTSKRPNSARS